VKLINKGAVLAVLAGGMLLAAGGVASADAGAGAAAIGSPGLLSGNAVLIPVDVPVNACGDSLDTLALLDPAFGVTCADLGTPTVADAQQTVSGTPTVADAQQTVSGTPTVADAPQTVSGTTADAGQAMLTSAAASATHMIPMMTASSH